MGKTRNQYQAIITANVNVLQNDPLDDISAEEMEAARDSLKDEIVYVKDRMGHGDIPSEVFTKVWDECYGQLLYLPNQQRYTRAALASKKDRVESIEKRLEVNRTHMTEEAKKAAKHEKKLKVLLGGYQSRALGLNKQISELYDQLEQLRVEGETFDVLAQQERSAIPRRIKALQEDVRRQTEREYVLQHRYSDLLYERDELRELAAKS